MVLFLLLFLLTFIHHGAKTPHVSFNFKFQWEQESHF